MVSVEETEVKVQSEALESVRLLKVILPVWSFGKLCLRNSFEEGNTASTYHMRMSVCGNLKRELTRLRGGPGAGSVAVSVAELSPIQVFSIERGVTVGLPSKSSNPILQEQLVCQFKIK